MIGNKKMNNDSSEFQSAVNLQLSLNFQKLNII